MFRPPRRVVFPGFLSFGSTFITFIVAHPPCREQAPYQFYVLLSLLCPCLGLVVVSHPCLYGDRSCLPHTTVVPSSPLLQAPLSFFRVWSLSVLAACRQAITGAILSYSSSASAPNLDPIAFKEAALARLRTVAVSFESGASRSTLAVALAVCLSSFRA